MKRCHSVGFLFLLLCMTMVSSAGAQEKVLLSIDNSIEIGIKNSKSLHASSTRVRGAEARSSEVNAARLPSLKFGAAYTRLSDVPPFTQTIPGGTFGPQQPPISFTLSPVVLNNYGLRLTLQQPLFTGFRLESSHDIADLNAQATQEDFNRDQSELIYSIKNSYWNLYKALEYRKVIDENVSQVKLHLNELNNLMNQGMATTNDVLRVQVQLSNAKLLQIDAKNNVHLAMLALNNVTGQPLGTDVELTSTPDSIPSAALQQFDNDVNKLILQAMDNRSEIKGLQYRLSASEAGVKGAKSGWYPQIYLAGNYYYSKPNQRILPTEDQFRDTWDVSINASLDLWNWGTTIHQTQQAQAQLAQAQDALGQLRDGITLEITQNYLNVGQSRERIAVSDQAVRQAEENYRVTNEKFKLGVALNSDLLDAEVALLQAKWNHIQALVDYQLSQARLLRSIGQ